MKVRRITAVVILVALVTGIIVITVHEDNKHSNTNGLQVVAAENFWGNIAQQLGGPYVHVRSIITDPNADPHLYESNAGDAADVATASVVVINGVGYDDFMNKLIGAQTKSGRVVLSAQHILGAAEGANPHLWYDIPRIGEVADSIEAAYVTKDPSHAAQYQHNLLVFKQSLQPLLQTIKNIKQKYAGVPVAYTEPVPAYTLGVAGLDVLTPEGFAKSIEDGVDPTPADTNTMDMFMTNRSVKVLLYNAQAVSPVTENTKSLAKQYNIPVVGVTETMPTNAHTFQAWQMHQLQELETALASTN